MRRADTFVLLDSYGETAKFKSFVKMLPAWGSVLSAQKIDVWVWKGIETAHEICHCKLTAVAVPKGVSNWPLGAQVILTKMFTNLAQSCMT